MKKIFLFALLSLPFAGFCSFEYDYNGVTVRVERVRRFLWFGYDVSASATNSDTYYPTSEDSLYGYFLANTFAVGVRQRNNLTGVVAPGDPAYFVKGTILNQNVTNSVYCTTNGVAANASLRIFPRLDSVFASVAALLGSGYSGPGFRDVYTNVQSSGTYYCVNVDFPALVSDVLSSTNSLYRSLVVSSLSDVNSSLSSIVSTLSSIASRPSSEVWDYDTITNFIHSSNGSYYFNGFNYDLSKIASDVDPSNYDFVNDPEARSYYDNVLSSYGRGLPLLNALAGAVSSLSSVDSDFNGLNSLGKAFNSDILNTLGSGSRGTGIAGDIKRLSTNDWASVVTNQLAQNTRDAKQQLKDNRDSITNQLAHMFDDNPNSVGRAIRSTAANTATAAQGVSAISSKLDSLHVQIDNPNNIGVVLDGPVTIDTTQFNGVSVPLAGLKDKIDTWYNDWFSFWDISTPAYSWDNFYNMIRDFKDQNHVDIASITNLPFFSSVSNSLASIDNYLQTNSFSSSLHALLLDDYADYITNRFYSSAVDTFKDDYPSVYTNLVKFGLSTDDGEGNFWSLISSTLFYQSALVCVMLEDFATVRQFADDHIEGGFSGGVTSLLEQMPSSTELADRVNMASNEVLKIEAAANSFYASYDTMTNTAVSAFSPFRGIFSSVPEDIVFFKTGNEQYITIPVSRGGNAWSVIRLCFSFSLVAVNVILFPKFVLMVIVLLSKLSKRFVKFVPTDNI